VSVPDSYLAKARETIEFARYALAGVGRPQPPHLREDDVPYEGLSEWNGLESFGRLLRRC